MGGAPTSDSGSDGGLVDSIKGALGLGGGGGGGVDQAKLEAAEQLTQEYADELQRHLESKGKWEQVRIAAME
jgi:hypothetical protein